MKPRMNFYQAAPDTIKALSALESQVQASGLEQSLILEGDLRDGDVVLRKGDYFVSPLGSSHRPLYLKTGCVLLVMNS